METSNRRRKAALYPFALIPLFIWIGFVCSISFMEAWLKFRAPGVSLPIGLSIGRLIFAALNHVEWVLAGLTALFIFLDSNKPTLAKSFFLCLPIAILALQTSLLLPSLNERAENIIRGIDIPSSSVHFYYLAFEAVKVLSLFVLGINVISTLERTVRSMPVRTKEKC